MHNPDKTKEELIKELFELYQSYYSIREQYDKEISLLKLAHQKVSRSEESFRKLFSTCPDAIIISRLTDGMYKSVNAGFTKLFGYAEEEVIGKISPELNLWFNPENQKNLVNEIDAKGSVENFETIFLRKDGCIINGLVSASLIDIDGVAHLLSITRDITSRKRMELENQIINEITQGVATTSNLDELLKLINRSVGKVVHAENCFVALNNQKIGIFNFPWFVDKADTGSLPLSFPERDSTHVFRTVQPFLFNEEIFAKIKEQNEVGEVESATHSWLGIPLQTPSKVIGVLVLQHYGKENVYSENDLRFLLSLGNQIAISIDHKKAEEEINLKNEMLKAKNAEKDKFFTIIAHDLRGPLSSFVAVTNLLTEYTQTMNMDEIKEITRNMRASAVNIYSLLENLLEWSRLRGGTMDFVPEKFNLKEKIGACLDVLSESARKKSIEMTFSIPVEMEVFFDNHMFDSIIRNLVSNAIKFTPVGGKVSVTAEYKSDKSTVIKISDSGIGMTTELKNKLFLLNERTSRLGTEGEPSTGLGLMLCKEFIEKHGGKIWVESEVNKGSVFSFTIPFSLYSVISIQ